jgi:hypothetical protein
MAIASTRGIPKNWASKSCGSISSRNIPPGDLIVFGFLEPSWCVFKLKRDSGASLWATPPRSRKFQRASGELQLPGRRQAKPITATGSCEYAAFEGRMLPGGTSFRTPEPIWPRKVKEPLPRSLNAEADFTYFVDSERVQALRGQKILQEGGGMNLKLAGPNSSELT